MEIISPASDGIILSVTSMEWSPRLIRFFPLKRNNGSLKQAREKAVLVRGIWRNLFFVDEPVS